MLRYRYSVPVYGGVTVGFRVDAERVEDAHTIATAYLLTHGHTNFTVRKHLMALEGGSPDGTKPGIVQNATPSAFKLHSHQQAAIDWLQKHGHAELVYSVPPCAAFAVGTVKARVAEMIDEGVVASFKDGRGWINLYMREDGSVHAGGIYTSKAGAETIATRNGNGYRSAQALMTWDRTKGMPDKGKLYPDGNGGWQKADGKPVSIKPVPTTREEALRVFGERVKELADEVQDPLPVQYASWSGLTSGERQHFKNRLMRWAGLHAVAGAKSLALSINEYEKPGGELYITISVSSPRWQEALNRLKEFFGECGIAYTMPSYSTVNIKWAVIAQYLTPL